MTLRKVFHKAPEVTLSIQEGGVIVLIGWVTVILFSAWPFAETIDPPFSRALFEFASALGTVGLSMGVTSADMPDPALWVEIFAMSFGRLEFMVVVVSRLKLGKDSRLLMGRAQKDIKR